MDCKDFKNNISPYIDNMLDYQDIKEFENHLSHCPDCRSIFEETQTIVLMLGELGQEALPQGFNERVIKNTKSIKKPGQRQWIRWVSALAAVFIIFFSVKAIQNMGSSYKSMDSLDSPPPSNQEKWDGAASPSGESDFDGSKSSDRDVSQPNAEESCDDTLREESADNYFDGLDEEKGKSLEDIESEYRFGYLEETIKLYVEDKGLALENLKSIAQERSLKFSIDESSISMEITSQDERDILYRKLSELGRPEIINLNKDREGNIGRIKIIVIFD